MAGQVDLAGQRVATVICGGNATRDQLVAFDILEQGVGT
jgi:hypothetical protein